MMANGWKTPDQIQEDYHLSQSAFYTWKTECEESQFKDAIIRPTGKHTYIVEQRWQEFITWRSDEREKDLLDPHLRVQKESRI
ncbi:Predicted protein [Lactobacillus hominis DSM 23910 = CRBIP 24.179]|uniref:Transposase n=1 Tax=Lactobacillus hominis DSM 23910 = CRBIP 24.179 TaxID=1423758 RepID=I7LAJ1_9LACO|nr:hypothetical protein [Lactobacillus hominis]CCI82294.1 Predicted protein [Lactobacillus hominis DSM 23910 = CRBIP 24.179]